MKHLADIEEAVAGMHDGTHVDSVLTMVTESCAVCHQVRPQEHGELRFISIDRRPEQRWICHGCLEQRI